VDGDDSKLILKKRFFESMRPRSMVSKTGVSETDFIGMI